jgi:hypothetical protein
LRVERIVDGLGHFALLFGGLDGGYRFIHDGAFSLTN